jgi:hypothetical protein
LMKAKFGQVKGFPFIKSQARPAAAGRPASAEFERLLAQYSRQLHEDGVVILDGYFAKEVDLLRQRYRIEKQFCDRNMTYLDKRFDPRKEDLVGRIAFDPLIMGIIANELGCQPMMRTQPFVMASYPEVSYEDFFVQRHELLKKDIRKGNMRWHYDTPSQITCHVILEDCSLNTTHMLVAKGTNQLHHMYTDENYDYYYSEEYVRDHYQIIPCIGKRGTAVIFDNNALHRMNPIKNAYRCLLATLYTPGNSIYWWRPKGAMPGNPSRLLEPQDSYTQVTPIDMASLDDFQRASIAWFPKTQEEEQSDALRNKSFYND